jgi:phage tail sheath protein FI
MADTFLHGVEVVTIDDGPRPISVVNTSVIGLVGTAPNADPNVFPLNTPVLIAGSQTTAAKLDTTVSDLTLGAGTLPDAVDSIFKQTGAVIVVVRVAQSNNSDTDPGTIGAVIGGVDPSTGQYKGIQAFLAAESIVGFSPRILIAPGFTNQRVQGGVIALNFTAGAGYTDGTYNLVVTGGTGGTGAAATATITGGKVVSTAIVNSGSGYTVAPNFALPAGAGTPTTAATFAATIGTAGNAVVADLIPIAQRLRAVIIQDGTNTNDTDAISQAGDFGSERVYLVDPKFLKTDGNGNLIQSYSSAAVAGLLALSDNENGWWWSPSNQLLGGVQGTSRAIDFKLGDPNSRANLLNSKNVATIIRSGGYRLWGNRTLSADPKWQFLCVVRTADIINDSLAAAHLWAVDRGITKNYVTEVIEGVNAFLRNLVKLGAILGGTCWADPDLNTADQVAAGHVYFDFDFTPAYPAEHVTFRSRLVDNYVQTIFN